MNSDRPVWLIFDLGGVLIDVEPLEATLARLAAESDTPVAELREPLREAFASEQRSLSEQFQWGDLDEAGFLAALDARLTRPLGPAVLARHMAGMLRGAIAETPALLAGLAARYPVACYSNTNPVHWRAALARFDFMGLFRHAMASHEERLAKPDARVFERVEARLGAAPDECLLIDDRRINVDAARAAGWHALPFTDADTLRRDLAARGITP